eukprot:scaffold22595_cov63-Phaeocystis_antarctica.AAC.9
MRHFGVKSTNVPRGQIQHTKVPPPPAPPWPTNAAEPKPGLSPVTCPPADPPAKIGESGQPPLVWLTKNEKGLPAPGPRSCGPKLLKSVARQLERLLGRSWSSQTISVLGSRVCDCLDYEVLVLSPLMRLRRATAAARPSEARI